MAVLNDESMNSNSPSVDANSVPRTNKGGKMLLPEDFAPGPHSVVCGRGKVCSSAEGNKRLKTIVDSYLKPYSEAKTKLEKSAIVSTIVGMVKQSSTEGAFVKLEDGRYWEVEDGVSREKVGCMLRDCLHSQYRSSTKSKLARRRANKVNEGNQTGMQVPFFAGVHRQHNPYHGSGSGLNFSNHSTNTSGLDFSNHSTNSYEMNFSNRTSEFDYSNHSSTSRGLDYRNLSHSRSSGLDFDNSNSSGLDFNSSFANGLDFSNHDRRNNSLSHPTSEDREMTGPAIMGNLGSGSMMPTNPLGMTQQQQQTQHMVSTKGFVQNYMVNGANNSSRVNYLRDVMPISAHLDIMGPTAAMCPPVPTTYASGNNISNNSLGTATASLVQQSVAQACHVMSAAGKIGGVNNNNANNRAVGKSNNKHVAQQHPSGNLRRGNGLTASRMTIDEELPEDLLNVFDDM